LDGVFFGFLLIFWGNFVDFHGNLNVENILVIPTTPRRIFILFLEPWVQKSLSRPENQWIFVIIGLLSLKETKGVSKLNK
jgi:hypothetical protein